MADNLTDYGENLLLEKSVEGSSYLALFTVSPTDTGLGTEVSGSNYKRRLLTWGVAKEGSKATSVDTKFPEAGTASEAWGTIVAIGIFDAASVGNLVWYGPLSASVTIKAGDTYTVKSGGLTLSLS